MKGRIITTPKGTIPLIKVDFDLRFEKMVAAGCYDYRDRGVCGKSFRVRNSGVERFMAKPYRFGGPINFRRVLVLMRSSKEHSGWKLAKIEHLLAFGAQHPDEQFRYPIFALGQRGRVRGRSRFAYISAKHSRRFLSHVGAGATWRHHDQRFLIVKSV